MRTVNILVLVLILSSSFLSAERSTKEIPQKPSKKTPSFDYGENLSYNQNNRTTGGIINSSAIWVIQNGGAVVISNGNYRSIGTGTTSGSGNLLLTGDFENNNSSGNPFSTSGTVIFNGSSEQQIIGSSIAFGNVSLANSNGMLMGCDISVAGNLTLTSGNLNLNGKTVTLGGNAILSENGGRVFGNTGSLTTTRDIGAPSSDNIGGLGAEITSSTDMGITTITRCHTAQTGAGVTGIQRYYDISPENNEGLNATLVFHYNDNDLIGHSESMLSLWKSEDSGSTWTGMGGIVNETNNTITLNEIDSFSRWTASDNDNSLPVTLSQFNSQFMDGIAVLSWITQSETNNLGWNVYRSLSNDLEVASLLNYELIPGAGTTNEITYYSYQDMGDFLPETTYWYWLESVASDGGNVQYDPVYLTTPENIEDPQTPNIPNEFGLYQNYPNPFNPETHISFALKEAVECKLIIYNLNGELVRKLFQGPVEENRIYNLSWDGKDENSKEVKSGMYIYQIKAGKYTSTKKMLLLR